MNKLGDAPAQIQQRVQFDGRLGSTKPRPREQGKAQIDGRGVQRVNRRIQLDAEVFVLVKVFGDCDENLSKVGVDSPIAIFVGVG